MRISIIIICAFIIDIVVGDPNWLPHPISFIGNMISKVEVKIRKLIKNDFFGGVLLSIFVIVFCFIAPFTILYIAKNINIYLYFVIELYFCFQIIAAKSLKVESMKVYRYLKQEDIKNARKYLSYIVGRDTEKLDNKDIKKATVETIAENTTDGVIAPLLFIAIGGAPLGFLYKAVNTLDSMIGYKNKDYLYFGKFAARLDDILNFIPARIAAFLMLIGSFIIRLDFKNAINIYIRDRKNHKSPNSAQTESVCAGALNIQLAGDSYYFGKLVKKLTIGDRNKEIETEDIKLANKLMYATAILGALIFSAIRWFIWI
ncbi:MAG: adenosylcobinamide-phosphate synthase [Fusobacteria bacterium]|nr:MAG: adenosylcobinamide-phosphate synthase [Fusobacteriota bacterium]KAF0228665.1 MAG: adenosylcobinamide-phosphate [Fusobacteriota bacterium]